ncbi:putative 2-dehydropantoate 2-reductase [Stieleria varia]|uniref:2-dehydropantoate 2-reductase n=1 Tax=Stieleria varia TaxID=2528005 RepID=A0A5C6AU95_9BACT|nr:putative 2-dehydropantoate 2-reductase [Stieleria varia]TWU03011.1 2-dehydropantoate 2-reductase [Stieleria varia]
MRDQSTTTNSDTSKRRYAILGTGALGGLYGGMLAKAGHEVHFLLRSDFDHVREHGLRVDSIWGDFHLKDVHAHSDAATIPPCDVTIVAMKTTANELLPKLLPGPTGDNGLVLVLQNGLGVEQDVGAIVGEDRVLGGCCFLCSNKVGPGHIKHIDFGRIVFGALRTPSLAAESLSAIQSELVDAGIDAHASDDLRMVRWRKLMWNIPFNGLSVALDASTKEIVEEPHSAAMAETIIREVYEGAKACGAAIDPVWIRKTMDNTRSMVPYDSSMRLDFLAGRPMELETIFARPIRDAMSAGQRMPCVEMLHRQLSFIQSRSRSN